MQIEDRYEETHSPCLRLMLVILIRYSNAVLRPASSFAWEDGPDLKPLLVPEVGGGSDLVLRVQKGGVVRSPRRVLGGRISHLQ